MQNRNEEKAIKIKIKIIINQRENPETMNDFKSLSHKQCSQGIKREFNELNVEFITKLKPYKKKI